MGLPFLQYYFGRGEIGSIFLLSKQVYEEGSQEVCTFVLITIVL